MAKKAKRLTRKERQQSAGTPKRPAPAAAAHIHCIACGRHIEPWEMKGALATATVLECDHGSTFASCMRCADKSRELIAEHDRTGQAVKSMGAWH